MRQVRRLLALLIALAVALTITVTALADFGDFSDGGDYGGGDYGYDYDYSSGSDRRSSSSGGNDTVAFCFAMLFIGSIIALIIYFVITYKKEVKDGTLVPRQNLQNKPSNLRPVQEYTSLDPAFNPAALAQELGNLYVRMQYAWTNKDISGLRPYFTPALFAQMEIQLRQKTEQGLTNYMERVSVRDVSLLGFYQNAGEDHMIARVSARVVDYTVEDKTGRIVAGRRDQEIFLNYIWDLSRTTGVTGVVQTKDGVAHCPNCGAPMDLNASAVCAYCDSVVQAAKHDWAISSIRKA